VSEREKRESDRERGFMVFSRWLMIDDAQFWGSGSLICLAWSGHSLEFGFQGPGLNGLGFRFECGPLRAVHLSRHTWPGG